MNKNLFEYQVNRSETAPDLPVFSLPNLFALRLPTRIKILASDCVALSIALICASVIASIFSTGVITQSDVFTVFGIGMLTRYMVFLPLLLCVFAYGGLYRRSAWEGRELERVVQGTAVLALCDIVLLAMESSLYGSAWMLVIWPITAFSVLVFRMLLRTVPFGFPAEIQQILLVGDGFTPEQFLAEFRESRCGPLRILQKVPLRSLGNLGRDEIRSRIKILADRFRVPSQQIRIVLAPSTEELFHVQPLVTTLSGLNRSFSITLPYQGLARKGLSLNETIGADFVLASIEREPSDQIGHYIKRAIDLLISTAAIVLLAPVLLTISALLKREGGAIFFTQSRVGKDGRRFRCFKFRSMRPDAEAQLGNLLATNRAAREEWEVHQKLADDPRVTRIGAFLRSTSLDELPQLFNVFTGDMSIVGPRPIIAPEVAGYENDREYSESADFAHYISCKPGITGLWQVSGRAKTSHRERIRLDRWYHRNWSNWLDMMIILKTVRAVLVRSGS